MKIIGSKLLLIWLFCIGTSMAGEFKTTHYLTIQANETNQVSQEFEKQCHINAAIVAEKLEKKISEILSSNNVELVEISSEIEIGSFNWTSHCEIILTGISSKDVSFIDLYANGESREELLMSSKAFALNPFEVIQTIKERDKRYDGPNYVLTSKVLLVD